MKYVREIGFIVVVSVVFAGLTTGVNLSLRDLIALNQETRDTKFLLDVFDIPYPRSADAATLKAIESDRITSAKIDGRTVFRSRDSSGKPDAYALKIGGKGFWGGISGLASFDAGLDSMRRIVFTSHNETPGLGARIDEQWFRDQFRGLALEPPPQDKETYISISSKKSPHRNHLDAVTGATMTSRAVEKFLNMDLAWIMARKDRIGRFKWPFPPER